MEELLKGLGIHFKLSTSFHPQTDGKVESSSQTLEDMLRACVIEFKGDWDDYCTLIEFAYDNNYYLRVGMALFEALCDMSVDLP